MERARIALASLITRNGLKRKQLNQPMKSKHLKMIAIEIGNDWECLGTCLNISPVDINDIWEVHRLNPLSRRFAFINLWKEQFGSEATYYNMAKGLVQLKRIWLTEKMLRSFKGDLQQSDSNLERKKKITAIVWLVSCAVLVATVMIYLSSQVDLTLLYYIPTFVIMQLSQQVPNTTDSHFNIPGHDLPILHGVFVGREHDINEVISRIMNTRIVNINGAPGFGKSTLAIHVGHVVVQNGIDVRYVNMEGSSGSFLVQKHRSNSPDEIKFGTALTQFHDPSLLKEQSDDLYADSRFVRELKKWTMGIKSRTILIFDNCNKVLLSSFRYNFVRIVKSLTEKSELINIVVVSRVKLFLLDSFDQWTVKELNQSSSVTLLNKLTPGINKNSAARISHLLQGCPLALKVVGKLLSIRGNQYVNEIITELEKRPIDVLDSVSDQKQQFRALMDLVLSEVKALRQCGYTISLFPYSFSREVGMSILSSSQGRCLEIYEKQSLLDQFFRGDQRRYEMHRLIREYFKEKVNKTDEVKFRKRLCKFYINFLFSYANKTKLSAKDKRTLSTERLNIELFIKYLHLYKQVPRKLLAVIAFLLSEEYVQATTIQRYFKAFILQGKSVCQHLNPVVCANFVTQSVRHLYNKCNCNSIMKYIKNTLNCPCKDIFQCATISWILKLHHLLLTDREVIFLFNIKKAQCIIQVMYDDVVHYFSDFLYPLIQRMPYRFGFALTLTTLWLIIKVSIYQIPPNPRKSLFIGALLLVFITMLLYYVYNYEALCTLSPMSVLLGPFRALANSFVSLFSISDWFMTSLVQHVEITVLVTCYLTMVITIIIGTTSLLHIGLNLCGIMIIQRSERNKYVLAVVICTILLYLIFYPLDACRIFPICY